MCGKLGVDIEIQEGSEGPMYVLKKQDKVQDVFNIIALNSFSKKRGRISVLVYRPKTETFTLYCKGDHDCMKDVIDLGIKDTMTYKQLIVNMKVKGLKKIVLASKDLTMSEYQEYMKNFKLVSKMTRNQSENFEKLFRDVECGMKFLGCLGIKNTIPGDVKSAVGNLLAAKIKVSMLTGDNLENATMAAIELGLSNSDFSDTSSYYSLRFDNETEGWVQIRRILDFLYESLKIVNVKDSQNKIKKNRQEQRHNNQWIPSGRKRNSTDEKSSKVRKDPEEMEIEKLREEMHKSMLISGNSVSIIE